ncbi:MAG TPA: hypothetical protein VGU22_15065 [Methylomirabilota bacterium]|jgi:DNA-binding Lrp family transcriptional regulator|nr:hypothetical protein [Methylomirabilota bacterium]
MHGWWDEIDEEIMSVLGVGGPMDPADIASRLGMSTDAVCSCLALLSASGRVRIRAVEARSPRIVEKAA